ncbi:bifunctional diguanylate cyclase/phosphodiesterase [Arabiibacter massiliensis]|uniref:bifunctional diguanylate cyclase/phosphodiesterase n=1 Tax=Arabiibacter massiliensis TaxID=1870985 RepID=UPI0009BB32B9|nr:EAL domain-containing protein [Arabiibacter massiliensis]
MDKIDAASQATPYGARRNENREPAEPHLRRNAPGPAEEAGGEGGDLRSFVFDTVLEGMRTSIYVTDPETDEILYMNGFMKHDFGVEDPEGKVCWQVLQRGMTARCEFCPVDDLLRSEDDAPLVEWDEESPVTGRTYRNYDSLVRWIDGSLVHLQQSVDVTELVSANTDELTGVLSRRAGKEHLSASLARGAAEGEAVSIALYDINQLKEVNDRYGHAEGDRLIRSAASAVRREFGPNDYGFRLSGDEFVCVFLGEASLAREKMERAQLALAAQPTDVDPPYEMGFCFGIAESYPESPLEMYEMLALADQRMYVEKRSFHIDASIDALRVAEEAGSVPAGSAAAFSYDTAHLYDALVESTDDYLYVCNMKTGVFHYPKAMVEEFGLPSEVVENAVAVWGSKVHEDDRQAFLESNQEIVDGRTTRHWVEYRARNRKGEWVRLRCRGRLILDARGKPSLFAGFIANLGKKSKVDPLTGLFNKFEFEDVVRRRMEITPDEGLSLMVIGIDDLRHINDRYDRAFGDEVIRFVAQRIQSAVPERARVFRLDGDEFAVAINDELDVLRSAYAVLSVSFDHQHEHEGKKFYCTLSGGCARYPSDAGSYEELVKYADYALEFAKGHGKKRCVSFSAAILAGRTRELELMELLRDSVENGFEGFSLRYQPQVEASTGRVKGAEALARWRCERFGDLSPLEFIPLLEESGLIVPVGAWVLREAAATCARWRVLDPTFSMSVNLSYRQLDEDGLVPFIMDVLEEEGLPPGSLVVEMTESRFAEDDDRARELFCQIRKLGVRVAMDDFGTGYSSLGALKSSPADIVKIDRAFIRDIRTSTFDATFIRFVVELCHDVGISVCLEGVETDEEYGAVNTMGLDYIQGFLFGRPLLPEEFEERFLGKEGDRG